jgi:bHLH factor
MELVDTARSDSNNNHPGLGPGGAPADKYSLRPRSLKKRAETELRRQQAQQAAAQHAAAQQQHQHLAAALQAGTPVVPRVAAPYTAPAPQQRASRPKQKPAPLSKYRRKTANARKRSRMREINVAFETLRRAVPHTAASACASEKLTKITTLRLAMKYIAALSQAVRDSQELECCESPLVDDSSAYSSSLFSQPDSPLLPTFDQFRGCGSASSSSSLSVAGGFGDADFADHNSLLSADFSDFPEPSLGMAGIADLVDPCLTAVALTSDDFYDTSFVTDFS